MQGEVPQNGGYMAAAYVIVAVVLLGYTASLWRRARVAMRKAGGQAVRLEGGQ